MIYLADNVPLHVQHVFSQLCPIAKIFRFETKKLPAEVRDLTNYKFKAVYQALTLQKFKLVLSIDTSVRFLREGNLKVRPF